jgi:hypothetical protein
MPLYKSAEGLDPAAFIEIRPILIDPSNGQITGRVGRQLRHMLDLSDLSDGAKKRCIDGLDIIVTKLLSVWSLRDSYAKLEKQLEEDARNNPVAYGGKAESAGWHDLYQYFELFSVQIKSVLDHMVYFLRHGVDQSVFGFNEKGQVIVNILENNIPKSASSVVKKNLGNYREVDS